MNGRRVFVDTIILVYAHDLDADVKNEIAGAILE
jgi:predicted nucleic acid-binding protein